MHRVFECAECVDIERRQCLGRSRNQSLQVQRGSPMSNREACLGNGTPASSFILLRSGFIIIVFLETLRIDASQLLIESYPSLSSHVAQIKQIRRSAAT